MTVASPLARQYYFMWLFFPITILIHRAAYDPRAAVRAGTWAGLAIAGALMCLSFPVFPNDLQAFGNNLAATAVIAGGLVWHILHPPPDERGWLRCRRQGYNRICRALPASPRENCQMSNAPQLQPVLDRIDADFDNIPSSGCLPCCGSSRSRPIRPLPEIARRPPIILPGISRRSALRPRSGRRPVIPPSSPRATARQRQWRPGRTCCSTVITTCSRSTRSISGIVRHSSL